MQKTFMFSSQKNAILNMRIIADTREKNSLVISELVAKGINVDFSRLNVGDFVISNEVAVERKTVNDFIGSMLNKRLQTQLINLRNNYSKPLLVIEGIEEQDLYKNERFKNLHENAIRGMLLSTMIDFKIPIIFTKDYEDTAHFLELLVKKHEKPKQEISLKAKRKAFSLAEQQQIIIESFPGIGPKLAKDLLKQFRTIKNIINADENELQKVSKINSKKSQIVKKIIDANYSG